MNKLLLHCLFAVTLFACKSTGDVTLNFDRDARQLQEKINDTNYTFYHEKHAVELLVPLQVPSDFRSERETLSGTFVYRLTVDETGKVSHQVVKPAPDYFEPYLTAIVKNLKFKPAWIGPANTPAEVIIRFKVEYEPH